MIELSKKERKGQRKSKKRTNPNNEPKLDLERQKKREK